MFSVCIFIDLGYCLVPISPLELSEGCSFDFVEYWKFTWKQKFEELKSTKKRIFQLCVISLQNLEASAHIRNDETDFSSGLYLVSKVGAEMMTQRSFDEALNVESNLFGPFPVISEAIFSCLVGDEQSAHAHHDAFHRKSFEQARNVLRQGTH
jgi:hypothetical protein